MALAVAERNTPGASPEPDELSHALMKRAVASVMKRRSNHEVTDEVMERILKLSSETIGKWRAGFPTRCPNENIREAEEDLRANERHLGLMSIIISRQIGQEMADVFGRISDAKATIDTSLAFWDGINTPPIPDAAVLIPDTPLQKGRPVWLRLLRAAPYGNGRLPRT